MRTLRLYTKIASIVFIAVLILGYGVYRTKDLLLGPKISIDFPVDGSVRKEAPLSVTGKVERSTGVAINNHPIFVDEEGRFEEQLLLFYGYNTITIQAQDKFGRNVSKTLQVVYN